MMVQRYVALAFEKGKVPMAQNLPLLYPYLQTQAVEIEVTKAKFSQRLNQAENRLAIGFCQEQNSDPQNVGRIITMQN